MISFLVFLACIAVPSALVALFAGNASLQSVAALCAGASAFSLMAINIFLSARPRVIEAWAGGARPALSGA